MEHGMINGKRMEEDGKRIERQKEERKYEENKGERAEEEKW